MEKVQEKSPFRIENLEEDTGFLMLQTSRLWEEYHSRALKKYCDLSYMQSAVLASAYWLHLHSGHEVTQTILARHTKIDPMTISQMLKVLEKKGYVYREPHPVDIRAKVVFLTEHGKNLMAKIADTFFKVDNRFFDTLGKNVAQFNKYLMSLLDAND